MSDARPQRSLLLILAREFASKLATPVLIVDADGMIVYFNEAAEGVLGQKYSETHLRSVEDLARTFRPVDAAGMPISSTALPIGNTLRQQRPTHPVLEIVDANRG